jgi:hypothetical protein
MSSQEGEKKVRRQKNSETGGGDRESESVRERVEIKTYV